jgi:hypothetical protein
MKKRKAPVLLVSILLVLIGAGVVVGMRNSDSVKPPEQSTPDMTPKEHEAPPATDVGRQIAGATKVPSISKMAPGPQAKVPMVGPESTGPSIAAPQESYRLPKPKPDASGQTGSGWYVR